LKASEAFFNIAKSHGVTRVYGNPGTTELPLLDALKKFDIEYMLALQDGLCVAMAEGESLYTRKPSIVSLHTVLGLGNSISYIYTSLKNRTPLIVSIGQQDTRHSFHNPFLYAKNDEIAKSVVKQVFTPFTQEDVPRVFVKAYRLCVTPPFGPVAIVLPMDYVDSDIKLEHKKENYSVKLGVDEEVVKSVAERLDQAKNPAIVAGYELDIFNEHEALRKLAEKLCCDVYAEPLTSRCAFPSDHPLFCGDLLPASALLNMTLAPYDFVLLVGCSLLLYPYTVLEPLYKKSVVEITYDAEEGFSRTWETHVCDVGWFLSELTLHVKKRERERTQNLKYSLLSKAASAKFRMGAEHVLYQISKRNAGRAVFDEAVSLSPILRSFLGYFPKRYFSARSGQLGWALPASIGFSLAALPSLAVIGDGSFNYASQALWSASKYQTDTVFIVLDNKGYAILKSYARSRNMEVTEEEWLSPETKAESVANAYGVDSRVASDLDSLESALDWALSGKGPKLLRIEVDTTIPQLF